MTVKTLFCGASLQGRVAVAALCLFLCLAFTACTVTPTIVRAPTASFDGSAQNSGFLGFDDQGRGILTAHAHERYNALIRAYGNRFKVPLAPDEGLSPGPITAGSPTWLIDREHLVKFQTMNRWDKSPTAPTF